MAKLAGLDIAAQPYQRSGLALVLEDKSPITEILNPSPCWEVSLQQNNPYIVANAADTLTREDAFHQGHEAIQESLDILSFDNEADLACTLVSDEHLIWWEENEDQHLRVVDNADLRMSTSATVTARDKDGNVVETSTLSTDWHEAMRYFRLAQVSNDLFDAYRNIYLSFERVLSHIEPKGNEGEGAWLRRALQNLPQKVDLNNYTEGSGNAIDDFMQEQYDDVRNKIFHAKEGQNRLRPQDPADQEKVQKALKNLTRLVITLIKETTQTNRTGGVITHAGFDSMTGWMAEVELEIRSHQRYPPLILPTGFAPSLSQPGLKTVLGVTNLNKPNSSISDVRNWMREARNRSIGKPRRSLESCTLYNAEEEKPIISIGLREQLDLESIDQFEVQTGVFLVNAGMARYQFPR